ncbi:hypothetical protein HUU53_01605 [Candidatus Micrarchaeota archaeon]|nr:hypothetical protein [Candidatus Micrarchaeota archaeon]
MKLVGGRIIKIQGTRASDKPHENLNIGVNIDGVRSENKKLVVGYTIRNAYEPSVAELMVSGEFFYEVDEKKLKEVVDEWNKEKTLDLSVTEEALNAANYAMGAVGTLLAFGLGLPAPINTPRTKVTKENTNQSKAS